MFSHRISRLGAAIAASLALMVISAGPARAVTIAAAKPAKPGKDMVSANNVQSVIDYLASKGDATTQDTTEEGSPMLTQVDNHYDVYFDCEDDHTNCSAIQFRACYSGYPEANFEKTNALSRDYFFAKSYMDKDGLACIELPVATGMGGISYEAIDRSFEAFQWFTQNTDEYFGQPSS